MLTLIRPALSEAPSGGDGLAAAREAAIRSRVGKAGRPIESHVLIR
jgi:hypothetical protein